MTILKVVLAIICLLIDAWLDNLLPGLTQDEQYAVRCSKLFLEIVAKVAVVMGVRMVLRRRMMA